MGGGKWEEWGGDVPYIKKNRMRKNDECLGIVKKEIINTINAIGRKRQSSFFFFAFMRLPRSRSDVFLFGGMNKQERRE